MGNDRSRVAFITVAAACIPGVAFGGLSEELPPGALTVDTFELSDTISLVPTDPFDDVSEPTNGDGILASERDVSLSIGDDPDAFTSLTLIFDDAPGTPSVVTMTAQDDALRRRGQSEAFFSFFYRPFADGTTDFPDLAANPERVDLTTQDRIVIDVVEVVGTARINAFLGTESSGSSGFLAAPSITVTDGGLIEIMLEDFSPLFGTPDLENTFDISFDFILNGNESLTLNSIYLIPAPATSGFLAGVVLIGARHRRP